MSLEEQHSTEVTFAILTQLPPVRFSALLRQCVVSIERTHLFQSRGPQTPNQYYKKHTMESRLDVSNPQSWSKQLEQLKPLSHETTMLNRKNREL